MGFIYNVFDVFFKQIMTQASLMLGIVTLIGYLAMKKKLYDAMAGAIKTAVGVMILQVGAGKMVTTFRPILFALSEKFGIEGVIIDPYAASPAVIEALGKNFAWVGYTVMVGFAWNILLVALKKWTKVRSLFLTGHVMFLQAALVTWMVYYYLHTGMVGTIIIAGILSGTYWAVLPNMLIKATDEITGGAGFTIGHQQMLGSWLATKIAPKLGDPKKGVEEIEYPGWLKIFNNNVVASAILMLLFFGIIMIALGKETVEAMQPGRNWIVHILLTGLGFSVNLTIILTGVRMFVAELTNSFQGVSEKLLPGAVIGVDCAAIYAFAPHAVLYGFIFGAIGQIAGVVALLVIGSPILIIPGFVPVFFDNATIGIYANKFGGARAAAIITFLAGLVHIFGGVWAASLSGLSGGWQGNFDWAVIWPVVMTALKYLGVAGVGVVVIAGLIVPQLQNKKSKLVDANK